MFDFEGLIRAALKNLGSPDFVVAFPYARPRRVLADMFVQGEIRGWIADSQNDASGEAGAQGWWTALESPKITLARAGRTPLVIVGVDRQWRLPRSLLAAAIASGTPRLATTDHSGGVIEDYSGRELLRALLNAALKKGARPAPDFKAFYDRMLARFGDRLRLDPGQYDPDRVLIFIGSLGAGGAERQASILSASLACRGDWKVHVACSSLSPPGDFFLPGTVAAGADVFEIPASPDLPDAAVVAAAMQEAETEFAAICGPALLANILQCAHVMRRCRAATVHLWMDYYNALGGVAATLVGVPQLVLSGRSVAPDNFRIFQPYMRPGYDAVLARRQAAILNNSEAGARDYERWLDLPAGRIQTVRNGFAKPSIDRVKARAEIRAARGWGAQTRIVGGILRFSEEKRPDFLVEVAIQALRQRPDLRFVIFGDGPLRPPLAARIATEGLAHAILLPGPTRDALAEMAAFDVFALASRIEGLPNVLVEAQLMGTPVICTGVGGMSETFVEGETGLTASGEDSNAFAEALLGLINEPDRLERMSAAALDYSVSQFSIARMVDDTRKFYLTTTPPIAAMH